MPYLKIIVSLCFLCFSVVPLTLSAQVVFELPSSPQAKKSTLIQELPTLPLIEKYRGEEKRGVRYLSDVERQAAQVYFKAGRLVDAKGTPLNPDYVIPKGLDLTSFPEQPESTLCRKRGFAIYVMDTQGRIYVSFEAEPHRFHHSSLAGGKAVAAAGEMIVYQGQLIALNNRSGHYRPPPLVLERVINVLTHEGVDLSQVKVSRFGSDF